MYSVNIHVQTDVNTSHGGGVGVRVDIGKDASVIASHM